MSTVQCEYCAASQEIEHELELQLTNAHKEIDILSKKLDKKCELLDKINNNNNKNNQNLNDELVKLQQQNNILYEQKKEYDQLKRKWEQEKDDLERRNRILSHEVEELENKLQNEVEAMILFKHEVEENDLNQKELIQRLNNELSEKDIPINNNNNDNNNMSPRHGRRLSITIQDIGTQTMPQSRKENLKWSSTDFIDLKSTKIRKNEKIIKYHCRYLMCGEWMKKWQNYMFNDKRKSAPPGPIDNSSLVNKENRKNQSIIYLPQATWFAFLKIYGGGPEIIMETENNNNNNNNSNIGTDYLPRTPSPYTSPISTPIKKRRSRITYDINGRREV